MIKRLYLNKRWLVLILMLLAAGITVKIAIRRNNEVKLLPTDTVSNYVTFDISPDESSLVFTVAPPGALAGGEIYLLNLRSGQLRQLTNDGQSKMSPVFSPDGKTIAYSASKDGRSNFLYVRSLNSDSASLQITKGDHQTDNYPSFSSDGSSLVFSRSNGLRHYSWGGKQVWNGADIYLVKIKDRSVRRLTDVKYSSTDSPNFIDKDSAVLFSAPRKVSRGFERPDEMFVVDTGNQNRVLDACGDNCVGSDAQFSPNGKYIVFGADLANKMDYALYRTDRRGSGRIRLSGKLRVSGRPRITSNPNWIYFITYSNTFGSELWKVDINGAQATRILKSDFFANVAARR